MTALAPFRAVSERDRAVTGRGERTQPSASLSRSPARSSSPALSPSPWPLDGAGVERTLDELLAGTFAELTADGVGRCPLCGGEMAVERSIDALPILCRCRGCATVIS